MRGTNTGINTLYRVSQCLGPIHPTLGSNPGLGHTDISVCPPILKYIVVDVKLGLSQLYNRNFPLLVTEISSGVSMV